MNIEKHLENLLSIPEEIALPGNNGKYYFFYKTINKVTGKFYFGVHETFKLNDGYVGSGKYLKSSIKKYGSDNFVRTTLKFFMSSEDMFSYEKEMLGKDVVQYIIDNKLGYNIGPGGSGGFYIGNKSVSEIRVKTGQFVSALKKRPDGTSVSSDLVASGRHYWLSEEHKIKSSIQSKERATRLVDEGRHHFLTEKHRKLCMENTRKLLSEGKHPFQTRPDGTNITLDRTRAGENPFSKRDDGTSIASDMIANGRPNPFSMRDDGLSVSKLKVINGTHESQKMKKCEYCGKEANLMNYSRDHGVKCKNTPEEIRIARFTIKRKDCEYCGKNIAITVYGSHHGAKCLQAPDHIRVPRARKICEYCGKDIPNNVYAASHGSKCKMNTVLNVATN